MPDEIPAPKPGSETTEWHATKMTMIAGFALALIGAVQTTLAQAGATSGAPPWLGLIASAIGLALPTIKSSIYTAGRNNVKIAYYNAQASADDLVARAAAPAVPPAPQAAGFVLVAWLLVIVLACLAVLPAIALADDVPEVTSASPAPESGKRVAWRSGDQVVVGVWLRDDAQTDRDAASLKAAQASVPVSWWVAGMASLGVGGFALGYKLARR